LFKPGIRTQDGRFPGKEKLGIETWTILEKAEGHIQSPIILLQVSP